MSAPYLYSHFLRSSPSEPQPRLLAPSSATSASPPARLISQPSTSAPHLTLKSTQCYRVAER
eukprot:SAG22_NODE_20933_length_261_cov_0.950617_1_plen_61_part_01